MNIFYISRLRSHSCQNTSSASCTPLRRCPGFAQQQQLRKHETYSFPAIAVVLLASSENHATALSVPWLISNILLTILTTHHRVYATNKRTAYTAKIEVNSSLTWNQTSQSTSTSSCLQYLYLLVILVPCCCSVGAFEEERNVSNSKIGKGDNKPRYCCVIHTTVHKGGSLKVYVGF